MAFSIKDQEGDGGLREPKIVAALQQAARGGPLALIKAAAVILKKQPKGTILIGQQNDVGLSLELVESKHDKWILDGWSVDAFGGKKSIGMGVAKDLWSNDLVEVDAGVYVTRPFKDFFDKNTGLNVSAGISAGFRF